MGNVDVLARAVIAGDCREIDSLFAGAGIEPPQVVVQPQVEQVTQGVLRSLYAYWLELRSDDECPAAAAVDPLAMRFALGQVMLVDVLDGGVDFRVRLFGTIIADRLGFDLTGRRMSDMDGPIMPFFVTTYRCAMLQQCAIFTRHASPPDIPVAWWERLVLPLSDTSGAVSRLLVGKVGGPSRTPQLSGFMAPLCR